MRDGAFKPTSEPTSAVCFGCPAAARLCPHPKWRPAAAPGAEATSEPELAMAASEASGGETQGRLFE